MAFKKCEFSSVFQITVPSFFLRAIVKHGCRDFCVVIRKTVARVCRLFGLVCDYYEDVRKRHGRAVIPLIEPFVRVDWKLKRVTPDLGSAIPNKGTSVPCFAPP